MKLPRLCTQRATLTALLLASAGCRIGGVTAIAPAESDGGGDTISISESPALGSIADAAARDAAVEDATLPTTSADAAVDACASDTGLCVELPEGCSSERFEEHVYVFCRAELPWQAARTSCRDTGLDLVIIDSDTENAFVAEHIMASSWIGAHDSATEGSFQWIAPGGDASGAAVTFASWAPAVPDNCGGLFGQQDCVRLSLDGHWDDSDCNGGCLEGTFAFVCESY